MYAVIRSGSKQYRVAPGETVKVERLPGKVGGKVTFGDVLAVRTDEPKLVTGKQRPRPKSAARSSSRAAIASRSCSSSRPAASTRFSADTGRITPPSKSAKSSFRPNLP